MRIRSSLPLLCLTWVLAPMGTLAAQDTPFRWSVIDEVHGSLALPTAASGNRGGWTSVPEGGFLYRAVPTFSGDTTVEVLFRAPSSGHPTMPERVLVQFPADFLERPFAERAMVLAFHSFGVSEKDIFLNTELPMLCRDRGWMLIAPYGLTDTSFANEQAQTSLETVLRAIYAEIPFNYRRIYSVGFSMGGLGALSFAARHRDPRGVRVAGVVFHTGPLDLAAMYENSSVSTKLLLANPEHFGASPRDDPFSYERVSPVRWDAAGNVDPGHAPVVHLENLPVFLHTNLADPSPNLVNGVLELQTFLLGRGAEVYSHVVFDPDGGHNWMTLPMSEALDTVSQNELGGPATRLEIFADRPVPYGAAEVRALPWDTHAHFVLDLEPGGPEAQNGFALEDTTDLVEVAVDTELAGLDPGADLAFRWSSADGTGDSVVLTDYTNAPRGVELDGAPAPSGSWAWSAVREELSLQLPADGLAHRVVVLH